MNKLGVQHPTTAIEQRAFHDRLDQLGLKPTPDGTIDPKSAEGLRHGNLKGIDALQAVLDPSGKLDADGAAKLTKARLSLPMPGQTTQGSPPIHVAGDHHSGRDRYPWSGQRADRRNGVVETITVQIAVVACPDNAASPEVGSRAELPAAGQAEGACVVVDS